MVTKGDHAILAIECLENGIQTLEWFDFMPTRGVGIIYDSSAQTYAGVYGDDYVSLLAVLKNEAVPGVVRICPKRGGEQVPINLTGMTSDELFTELGWSPYRHDSCSITTGESRRLEEIVRRDRNNPPTFQIAGRPNPNCLMWIKQVVQEALGRDLGYGNDFFSRKIAVRPTNEVGQNHNNSKCCNIM